MTETMIKLTSAQSESIKGDYGVWAIRPVKIGRYYFIPANVLNNPAYSEVLPTLSTLPIVELEIVEQNND